MTSAAYYRAWRAAHPAYRARQNRLRNDRRAAKGRGDRSAEYAARPSRALPPIPPLHTGHALFDQARAIVGPRRSSLTSLLDPLYDDLMSEATLAIVEGRDPVKAVEVYGARERAFGRATCMLYEAFA